jgi:hypothetical protein
MEARRLQSHDWGGKSDPYVVLELRRGLGPETECIGRVQTRTIVQSLAPRYAPHLRGQRLCE